MQHVQDWVLDLLPQLLLPWIFYLTFAGSPVHWYTHVSDLGLSHCSPLLTSGFHSALPVPLHIRSLIIIPPSCTALIQALSSSLFVSLAFVLYLFNSSPTQPPGVFLTPRFNHFTAWCKSLSVTHHFLLLLNLVCMALHVLLRSVWAYAVVTPCTANSFSFLYHVVFRFYALVHAVPSA